MFNNSVILITGGTGSWGNELTSQLFEKFNPKEIRIFSRGEFAQVTMERKFVNPKLKFIIGDIRDFTAINNACKGVDYVFHLSALKHVPICEEQPTEAIKTNVEGTANLINAAINNKVTKVIDVSTDKAVDPTNTYGVTKLLGERLIIHANTLSDTKFICIRGGNVLGSNGSVVPYFIHQIKTTNKIKITDFKMTRFFLTLKEAIGLLFKASESSIGGETFVMKMNAYMISDIALVLKKYYGNKDTELVNIGIRPGEKIHEKLVSEFETQNCYIYDDNHFVVLPTLNMPKLTKKYAKLEKVTFKSYSSADFVMNINKVEDILKKGGFLDGE